MSEEVITKWYLHADLDAFFASVEQLDNPEYRGKPVIVGGLPEDRRSVVSTASYEARKFGIHSAMPTFQAYKLCPQGIFVHGRMHRYAELSHQIMNIFRDYSPDVDQMSIDEAFIDLTGTEKLFGPPEETARKIKERIKEETGLTISTGLAATKYLAKIASGLSKPDGFYIIHPGDEKNFMLNLPLNKVWGLGPKSLELIRSKGITSTRDIYEKDYNTLEFLFGKNMAGFLYNVVRGIEKESFSREAKSHSISAETTFPYDLTDIYMIETELLELAHGVFFRLLKEESFSRTVIVKIRYDDFSTCTVQETSERNIITLDSFFEIIKRLFEKRYQNGRGIRLLGVGFENIVKEEKPYQQDLFNTGNDEKKQAVEKAILKLSKKHPEIKVSKARTLKAILTAVILTGFLSPAKVNAQNIKDLPKQNTEEVPEELSLEAPPTLFDFDINDENHVELTLDGFWEGRYEQNLDFTFGNKTAPAFSFSPPVFKQDVELYTLLMLNKHWYFEADFADEFKKNTVAAGYVGEGLIRSARLANRGITMPLGYSADFFGFSLSGGDNQAPGYCMHLASPSDIIQADFLLRYDMTSLKSAVFYGMNSVSDRKLPLSGFVCGREFRFPEGAEASLNMMKAVYIEAPDGNYKDRHGRKYRKLGSEEYLYLPLQNRLIIASDSLNSQTQNNRPAILITFSNSLDAAALIGACGSWNDNNSFFGKLQTLFGKTYKLEDFVSRLYTEIDGNTAIVLQDSIGFSPFMCAQYYDTGSSQNSDISIISKTTELTKFEFDAVDIPEYYTSLFEDFFYEKHHLVRIIYNEDLPVNIDEETAAAFPFALVCPESYLNIENSKDLCILIRSYTPQNELNIGKNAAAGTVQIYKNGILLHNSSYDKNTGVISLGEAVTSTDKITVTWQEDNTENSGGGAAVLGAGIKATFLPCLSGDLIFTGRWPLYPEATKKYISAGDNARNGFAALSTGITYERNGFELTEKTALSIKKENTTNGLIVVNSASPLPQKYFIGQSDSQLTQEDSQLEHWCAVLELPEGTSTPSLTSRNHTDIHLAQGSLIKNSDTLLLTLKPEIAYSCTASELEQTIDVYLILGIEKGNNFEGDELEYYPHWKLNDISALKLSENQWQTITLNITQAQQSKINTGSDARLLVIKKASDIAISGAIKFGAYEPIPRSIYTQGDNSIAVKTYTEEYETDKYASVISWNSLEAKNKSGITASSFFEPSDLSGYKDLSWDFSFTTAAQTSFPVTLILDNGNDEEEALRLELNASVLKKYCGDDSYHKLKIETEPQNVYIDNNKLDFTQYNLILNSSIIPSRLLIKLGYSPEQSFASSGKFCSGIITYEDSKLYVNLQNYTSAQYIKNGNILSIKTFPLIKDAELRVSSLQDLPLNANNQSQASFSNSNQFSIKSDAKAKATISGITTQTELSFLKEKLTFAGHELSTDSSVIPVVSTLDNYRFNLNSKEINKKNQFGLDFSRLSVPLKLSYETAADDTLKTGKQNAKATLNYVQPIGEYQLGLSSDFAVSQKTGSPLCTQQSLDQEQYFEKWAKITQEEFSQGKSDALNRNEDFKAELFGVIPATILTFSPKLSYGLGGKYSNAKETFFTDNVKAALLLPFSFDGKQLSLEISRNGGGTTKLNKESSLVQKGSYYEDADKVLSLQKDRYWFYTSIPFYEIFDNSLRDRISDEYSSKYEVQFSRRLFNSIQDLYIPSSISFAVTRDIKNQEPQLADVWQLKLVLTNTSINNFGRNSQHEIFGWFLQEEILSRLTGITRIPYNSNTSNILYQLNAYIQIMLYIQEKSILTSIFDITAANEPVWSLRSTFSWERPSQTSLITSAAYLLFPSSKAIGFEITRKDTFSIEAEKNHEEVMQKYSINHSASIKFKEHYSVNGGIGAGFTNRSKHAQKLSLSFSLGAKAEF